MVGAWGGQHPSSWLAALEQVSGSQENLLSPVTSPAGGQHPVPGMGQEGAPEMAWVCVGAEK